MESKSSPHSVRKFKVQKSKSSLVRFDKNVHKGFIAAFQTKTIEKAFRVSGATGLFSNKINGEYACEQPKNSSKRIYHTDKTFKLVTKDDTKARTNGDTTISFCHMDDGKGHWMIERWGLTGEGSCYLLGYCKMPNLPHPANAKKWYVINSSEQWVLQPAIKFELAIDSDSPDQDPKTKASQALRSRITRVLSGF